MHIGRAPELPPDVVLHADPPARATLDLPRPDPVVIAHASAPTGDTGAVAPTYNPVTDLIHRMSQIATAINDAVPPMRKPAAETYRGTPPAPSLLDLRA